MRITKKVFLDLTIYMISFGVLVGIIFPLFSYVIGIPKEYIFNYVFVSSCIMAGIVVGLVNIILTRVVVGKRLNNLSTKMQYVYKNIMNPGERENADDCLEKCFIPVDSEDVIGETADSYNKLIRAFLTSITSEESIREFTEIFTNELDIAKLSNKALSHLIHYTKASAGMIVIDQGGHLDVADSYLIKDPESVTKMQVVHRCFETNKRIVFDLNEEIKIEAGLLNFFPKAILIEPISYKNEVLGVILLASARMFEETTISQMNVYTHGLSLGMHNAIIHDKLQKLAVIDPLTKVYNRRFGMGRLREEFGRSIRTNLPFGIMMLDIDFFKKTNDTYGHLVGDYVLTNFCSIVKNILRQGDILIRYGGEEFLVILPGASLKGTLEVAEKIRRIIEENAMKYNNQEIKMTVSIGVSSFPEFEAENVEDLIHHADLGLYQAKDSGRNKVVYKTI